MTAAAILDPLCDDVGLYGWDTAFVRAWSPAADWGYASDNEPANAGGLANRAALATAVVLSLYTDRQCPADHPLAKYAEGDRRGWWGDALLEDGEEPVGSLLWLLERSVATDEMRLYAAQFAQEALAWMVTAGACARVDCAVELYGLSGFSIAIALYGRDDALIYDHKYEPAWRQAGLGGGAQ